MAIFSSAYFARRTNSDFNFLKNGVSKGLIWSESALCYSLKCETFTSLRLLSYFTAVKAFISYHIRWSFPLHEVSLHSLSRQKLRRVLLFGQPKCVFLSHLKEPKSSLVYIPIHCRRIWQEAVNLFPLSQLFRQFRRGLNNSVCWKEKSAFLPWSNSCPHRYVKSCQNQANAHICV